MNSDVSSEELKRTVGSRTFIQASAGVAWWLGSVSTFLVTDGHASGFDQGLFLTAVLVAAVASMALMSRLGRDFLLPWGRLVLTIRLFGWILFGPPGRKGGAFAWIAWAMSASGILVFAATVILVFFVRYRL